MDNDDEALAERLAEALRQRGLEAASWQSGGDIYVVEVSFRDGRTQHWGVAAGTWGGYELDEDGEEKPSTAVITEYAPPEIEGAADFIAAQAGT